MHLPFLKAGPGNRRYLVGAMFFYMIIGLLAMRRSEWASPKACLFVAGILSFLVYLFTPDSGFGGDAIKIRFVWAIFVFGCLAASTVSAFAPLRVPVAIFTTCFLTATLLQALKINVRHVSRAAKAYEAALQTIPPGSRFVRLRFPTEMTGSITVTKLQPWSRCFISMRVRLRGGSSSISAIIRL